MQHFSADQLPHVPVEPQIADDALGGKEPKGCLFALSQPPLILFLAVIGVVLLLTAVHDLLLL